MIEKEHLSKHDSVIKKIISTIPYPEIKSTNNVFHDLMGCVIEQQIHYRSTKKTFQKLLNKANIDILTINNFSEFEAKAFSDIKLSIKKYETILNLLQFWKEHKIDWSQLTEKEIIKYLSEIKGIGKWSIDMILIYTLERPNVFSFDDYHIKLIMSSLYQLDSKSNLKKQMKPISEIWSPYKSSAFKYLIAWKEFNKKGQIKKFN